MEDRVTVRLKRPNPLVVKLIEDMYNRAVRKNSKSQRNLKVALESIKRYPLVLESGSECGILKGFGNKLCKIIDKTLFSKSLHPIQLSPSRIEKSPKTKRKNSSDESFERKKTKTNYVPRYRTGAYAILVTLSKSQSSSMSKKDLKFQAKTYCNESFTKYKPGTFYTAWSSMATLISKGYVIKENEKTIMYSLSESGRSLAEKLLKCGQDLDQNTLHNSPEAITDDLSSESCPPKDIDLLTKANGNSSPPSQSISNDLISEIVSDPLSGNNGKLCIFSTKSIADASSSPDNSEDIGVDGRLFDLKKKSSSSNIHNPISEFCKDVVIDDFKLTLDILSKSTEFAPSSFEVILLVDKQETSGSTKEDDATIYELNKYKMIKYELRHLKVGDFTWVARHLTRGKEVVLPHIVERKRMDDLAGSIKDGRFHEQKFRLKQCGIPNVIYLIESHGNNQRTALPYSTLMQAATNTRIQDGFMTHFTPSLSNSIKFLAMMTKLLFDKYSSKTLLERTKENVGTETESTQVVHVMEFNHFNSLASKSKTLTVKDLFVKQLLQLKGVSVEKAIAIVSLYQTPYNLMMAFRNCDPQKRPELLLANIKYSNWKIGPTLSKTIYNYFTSDKLF